MQPIWNRILPCARVIGVFALMAFAANLASAQIPQDVSFTGRLVDGGGVPLAGPVTFDLSVFDSDVGGANLYSEQHVDAPLDIRGNFSVLLGSGTPISGTFNAALFADVDRYVEVELISPINETLTPRVAIASVPWALIAQQANRIVPDPNAPLSTSHLVIPASAFTAVDTVTGWTGSQSGTNRNFGTVGLLFAPVQLPHGATVTQLLCGGSDAQTDTSLQFTLRRNNPQQANVDMAFVESGFAATGFQFLATTTITSPQINNNAFLNYYMVAAARNIDIGTCPNCTVNFCRIAYTSGP